MADLLSLELPALPGVKKARKRKVTPGVAPDQTSALGNLGQSALSGIGYVAGALDKPGRAVRAAVGLTLGAKHAHADDLLAFVPFSDAAGLTDPQHAVSTRQIMDDKGAPANIDGFHPFAHPQDALLDTLGFAGDTVLDPLLPLSLGGSALTKGGRFLKAAGLAGDVRKVAGPAVGKRVAGMTTTLRDVLKPRLGDAAGEAFGRARSVAKQARAAKVKLKHVADDPVSGLVGLGAPFREPSIVLGTGKTAQKVAGKMDALGRAVRFGKYSPVSKAVQMFHAPAGEATSQVGQELLMPQLFEAGTKARADARGTVADVTEELLRTAKASGLADDTPEAAARMRRILEGHEAAPPEFAPILAKLRTHLDQGVQSSQRVGVKIRKLNQRAPHEEVVYHASPHPINGPFRMSDRRGFTEEPAGAHFSPSEAEALTATGSSGKLATSKWTFAPKKPLMMNNQADAALRRKLWNESLDEALAEAPAHGLGGVPRDELASLLANSGGGVPIKPVGTRLAEKLKSLGYDAIINAEIGPGRPGDRIALTPDVIRPHDVHGESFLGDYFPRHAAPSKPPAGTAGKATNAVDPAGIGRQSPLKGIVGETEQVNEIIRDVHGKLTSGALSTRRQVADYIKDTYGHLMPATYRTVKMGKEKIGNRFNALAGRIVKMHPEQRARGLFPNHPFTDLAAHEVHANASRATAKGVIEALADPRLLKHAAKTSQSAGSVPIARLFKNSKLDVNGALEHFARSRGLKIPTDPDEAAKYLKTLGQIPVPEDLATDIARHLQKVQGPEAIEKTIAGLDSATNLFKALVTGVAPAFHVRNAISGAFQNFLDDQFSPRSSKEAWDIAHGRHVDVTDLPHVQQMLRARKLPETPQNATDMLRMLGYQHEITPRYGSVSGSVAGATGVGRPQQLGDIADEFTGGLHGSRPFSKIEAIKKIPGFLHHDTSMNPLKVRGVAGQETSKFGPAAAGEDVGYLIETLNRLAPFIHNLRKGLDPAEAAKRVKAAQIDYGGRNYTNFERQIGFRLFPFGKFSKGVMAHTAGQLSQKPGGKLAQTFRAMQAGHGADATTPDYVADTASIPLGTQADGSKRYVTGFGLMPEDPVSFAGGGVRGAMMEAISRMNPLVKALIEWGSGQSFFQKGPMGGRPLDAMDPLVGRILANVSGRERPVHLPDGVEFALANSPFSRGLSTVRTLTDPRKGLGAKAANTLTGVRVSDVSPGAQDAVLREKAAAAMKEVGAKSYSEVYFSKEQLAAMTPEERAKAQELMALMKQLAENTKARKKAKEKKA